LSLFELITFLKRHWNVVTKFTHNLQKLSDTKKVINSNQKNSRAPKIFLEIFILNLYKKSPKKFFYWNFFPIYRFDDIFLGIVAHKANIEPLHSEHFYFYKKKFENVFSYRDVLASHGYDNSDEMLRVWSEMRAKGYA
jgi:hypothetical protein